jgi:uncharacterized protein YutE (UPF0331/DUF86 family)
VEPARAARYVDKIDHARDRLGLMDEWREAAGKDIKSRLAAYKAFQEAAEAVGDLLAMALIDLGRTPKDDHANVEDAARAGVVPAAFVGPLHEATGLRNRLVHEYERLDTPRALASTVRLLPVLEATLEEVERWMRKQP